MRTTTATDDGCLVCGDPLAPRSTSHCGDAECLATVRAAKARQAYAREIHGVELPLWEAIADANVGGTLPYFTLPNTGKGSVDPLSTPKDAGIAFIQDNPGFTLGPGRDAGNNLRQSRVDEASLFDSSVASLMVAPSDDRSGGLPLIYNGTTTPGMLVVASSVVVNDGGVTYRRTTYDRSAKADTSALAKLPNDNAPVALGHESPVSSWQVNQRAHGLPADVYAFSADALIAAANDDDMSSVFSAADIAAGLSDPFGFMVDALSDSADAATVRDWALGNLADADATAAYGIASAFGNFTTPDAYIWQGSTPDTFAADLASPVPPVPVYLGTIDDRVALHNEAYAGVHALLVPAPKPVKTLPPVLPPYDGPTVHAPYDRAGYLLPTSLPVAAAVGHLPLFVVSSVWHTPAKHVTPTDGQGCYPCNPEGVAFCTSGGQHGYVVPGSGLVHDVQYVGPWPAAGDPHVLIGRGSIPVHPIDAAGWSIGGLLRVSADYVTNTAAATDFSLVNYPHHYPTPPAGVAPVMLPDGFRAVCNALQGTGTWSPDDSAAAIRTAERDAAIADELGKIKRGLPLTTE